MKKTIYAVMLLLSLSIMTVSCFRSDNEKPTSTNPQEMNLNQESSSTDLSESVCKSILSRLYDDYVFGDRFDQFDQVVDELFTNKAKQKLMDAYDYDCEGVCYAIWVFRTLAQDSKEGSTEESRLFDIRTAADNAYEVEYLDAGWRGSTLFTFVSENGKAKIDDFRTIFDESFESSNQPSVPNWVIGRWEYGENEVIEFTLTKFIYTVNGIVVEEGPYEVQGNGFIYLEGSGVCHPGYMMYNEALYFEGGDDVPLKRLSVPNWVIGKWEYDENAVIEFTPTKFIYTVNGIVVEEGPYELHGSNMIYLEGSGVCHPGYVMYDEAIYFEGGDDGPLKKL